MSLRRRMESTGDFLDVKRIAVKNNERLSEREAGDFLDIKRIAVKNDERLSEKQYLEGLEPMTPTGSIFSQPSLNCYILFSVGLKTQIDIEAVIEGLEATLIKHKRFSSIVKEEKSGFLKWLSIHVNIVDHVIVPFIEPADNCSLDFFKKYVANLASAPPLDPSRPLWQIHFLRVRSEDAKSSTVLIIHHLLGDGMSLMSLFLACAENSVDPQSLSTIPCQTPKSNARPINGKSGRILNVQPLFMTIYNLFLVIWYSIVDIKYFLVTVVWIKDSDTPIKGHPSVETSPKQIEHLTLSLGDFKIVKTAVNGGFYGI